MKRISRLLLLDLSRVVVAEFFLSPRHDGMTILSHSVQFSPRVTLPLSYDKNLEECWNDNDV